MVKDQVGRPQVSRGNKSIECDTFCFGALTLLVVQKEEHLACQKVGVGGDDLSGGAWHISGTLVPVKSRMETFWILLELQDLVPIQNAI